MYAISVSQNIKVNQVSSRTHPVRADSNLIDFIIGENKMKRIKLTKNKFAIVDDEDYEKLNQFKWHASCKDKKRKIYYAARRDLNGKLIYMHREILNPSANLWTDHKNNNKLDNRKENIRACSCSQNHGNIRKREGCTSKYKGVSCVNRKEKRKKRWVTYICGKYIGRFHSEIEAAKAYDKRAKEVYGEFAYTNF